MKHEAHKQAILNFVNKKVNRSSKVAGVEVVKEPFEKTATQKIRRFKYKEGENGAVDEATTEETVVETSAPEAPAPSEKPSSDTPKKKTGK